MDNEYEEIKNNQIYLMFCRAKRYLIGKQKICVSVSGGSDSDIIVDFIIRAAEDNNIPKCKIKFVFFNTGIEYQATFRHLEYLEKKYDIVIERINAEVPVPVGCKKFGLPFWSKDISEKIDRLQTHGFKWEDEECSKLIEKYPNCKSAIRWWCNDYDENSKFNICHIRLLKEFMIENPPWFNISAKCCNGAKKINAKKYLKKQCADMNVTGIRKSEGGCVRLRTSHASTTMMCVAIIDLSFGSQTKIRKNTITHTT